MLHFGQVLNQVVGPQAGALAHGRRLGRLQVRKSQAGEGPMNTGEFGEPGDHGGQASAHQLSDSRAGSGRCYRDIAARSTPMDDSPGVGQQSP